MEDLKEVFKQAAEIAQQVPENMQEAAFNRALDLLTNEVNESNTRRTGKPKRHSQSGKTEHRLTGSKRSSPATGSEGSTKARKASAGLGPKSAIAWLIESGFFSTGRTRTEVQEYVRTKRGYDLGKDQLGLAMLRLVREGVLERGENQDGQYEFKQPKP